MRRLTDNAFILPFIVLLICIWRIFVPQLPANDGLGWDGYKYYAMVLDGLHSNVLDSYLVLRIFPSLFIHAVLKTASVAIAPASVILSFKIMNTVLITLSAWMVKKIFDHYALSPIAQLTGFIIVFMNYGVLNFTFYYPVMTDTPAFFLSVALFYFFVKGELLNIFLTGIIGAFTWPILFPMSLALVLFPTKKIEYLPVKRNITLLFCFLCFVYSIAAGWYFIMEKQEKADMVFLLPLSEAMLPVSFLCVSVLFFFMPMVLMNKEFTSVKYYTSQLNGNRVFAVIMLFVAFLILRNAIPVNAESKFLTFYMILKNHHYAFVRPLITFTNHFNYFGVVVLLMTVFWRRFAAFITTFGLGVAGVVFFNLFVLAMLPESRTLIHFFSWLSILISLFIGQYRFPKAFYALVFLINLAVAKLWLFFDYDYYHNKTLPDGTIAFPDQWFFMHLGVWVTEQVWFWVSIIAIACLALIMLSLYKIELGKKALLFYKKFQPINI
jgi:hypothetical protein